MNNNDKIIFVTAYKNIGRHNWKFFQRNFEDYCFYFMNLANNIKYNLVCYIEDDVKGYLKSKFKFNDNILFENLNKVDSFLKKYNNLTKDIINSEDYQNKIPNDRKTNPEHLHSEYNTMNFSKLNFLKFTKEKYDCYDFYAWIDFGCIRMWSMDSIPKNINLQLLKEKITFHCFSIPDIKNKIHEYDMLKSHEIFFDGSQFIIHKSFIDLFENLCEKKIIDWIKINTTDDDQNLFLQIYYDNPSLFELVINDEYYSL